MSRSSVTLGQTIVLEAWSSIMASPSTERPDFGYLRSTGHVRLNERVNKVLPCTEVFVGVSAMPSEAGVDGMAVDGLTCPEGLGLE